MVLPNFLIIGTPKAGTTSLYHYLNQHPEIYFSPHKEPHFFSFIGEQQPHWGVKTLAEYEALFEGVTNEGSDSPQNLKLFVILVFRIYNEAIRISP
ncbi:MAG: sulfotransferase [Xenococcaceae cyanobacterium MO_188.B19]|nr:sulfotransferase [Xenococcaceae cyanobacterium MO_188.B19]